MHTTDTPQPMTPELAAEINSAMVAHSMFAMGLREARPPSLARYTLRQMLDATEFVAAEDKAAVSVNGSKTIRMVCDPRLVAALYTLYHYEAQDPEEGQVSTVVENTTRGLVVLKLRRD